MGDNRGERACTIWFTGLSGAGKTTTSRLVAAALRERGRRCELLDGDVIRQHVSKGLGFSKADRDENVRRIGWICELLTRNGVFACAAAISPYADVREELRAKIGEFLLVYCHAPLEQLEQRKDLYRRVRAGEIKGVSGVDAPYEVPADAAVEVRSDGSETPEQSAAKVIEALRRLGYI